MTIENIQIFLDDIAGQAPDEYKELMNGIAEHFYQFRSLSTKQRKAVHVTASKLGKQTPRELSDYASDTVEQSSNELLKELAAKTFPGRNMFPDTASPIADMLREMAATLNKYADKLK